MEGTSFATPMVAGLAGLLLSHDSSLTPSELKNLIIKGAHQDGEGIQVQDEGFYVINAKESFCELLNNNHPVCENSEDQDYFTFKEGDPGAPGDGVTISSNGGRYSHMYELEPLAKLPTTNFEVLVLGGGVTGAQISFKATAHNCFDMGTSAGIGSSIVKPTSINGVSGIAMTISQSHLDSLINLWARNYCPGVSRSEIELSSIIMRGPGGILYSGLDAAGIRN